MNCHWADNADKDKHFDWGREEHYKENKKESPYMISLFKYGEAYIDLAEIPYRFGLI